MSYSTIDKPTDYFNTVLYTGTGSGQNITVGFQPNWSWIKIRNIADSHVLVDSVRGATKFLQSNNTTAETTSSSFVQAFTSDGLTLGGNQGTSSSSNTYASWNWLAGTSFTNDASSTGIGTIDSAGSFNNTSGFSVVSYTGTGSNGTIKHGLSTAPEMYITKSLSSARSWAVYNQNIGNTKALFLNSTDAQDTDATYWNSTSPTSSVLSLGTRSEMNHSGENFIAYCFAPKQGYSKFGSYTGNGSTDGPFVYTGFKPAFVMTKRTDATGGWGLMDNKRPGFNLTNDYLIPNASNSEADDGSWGMDLLSNGWKARYNNTHFNADGGNYIFMAFAEEPLVANSGTDGVPATAG